MMLVKIILILFIASLAETMSFPSKELHERQEDLTCTTESCKNASEEIKSYINQNIDPCHDFYEFACGNFIAQTEISEDSTQIDGFEIAHINLNQDLKNILEESARDDSPAYEKILKIYYESCKDTDSIEKNSLEPMLEFLDYLGGWPIIDPTWDERYVDLTDLLIKLKMLSTLSMFDFVVRADERNSSTKIILFHDMELTFPRDYYHDKAHKNKINALATYITNTALLFKTAKKKQVEKDVKEIIKFEKNLSQIFDYETTKKIKLKKLADKFKKTIKLDTFVVNIFKKVNIHVDNNLIVGVTELDYYYKLAKLMETTPKRTIVNYLLWVTVRDLIIAMPKRFQDIKLKYRKVIAGISKFKERYVTCISLVKDHMQGPMGAVYAKRHFTPLAKSNIRELIDDLKKSFSKIISQVNWMTNETKTFALEKLNRIRDKVGYPDYYDSEDLFVNRFNKTNFNRESFFENYLNIEKLSIVENLRKFGKPVDFEKGSMFVAVINAFYYALRNSIEFPAGIFQPPFYAKFYPMYLTFGAIGYIIGHEITHGFDEIGRSFDKDGNRFNWWNDEDDKHFDKATDCVVDQYDGYVDEKLNHNVDGTLTLNENIADNGGVRTAYFAYQHWTKRHGNEKILPDLPYNPQQLFFISFARIFCSVTRPEAAMKKLKTDVHAPNRFRVIGSITNMEEFSEVFQCPLGSPMNPHHKCRVW